MKSLKTLILLCFFFAAGFFSISCETTKNDKKDGHGPDLEKMTPEQRADYEAYLNAKKRFEERNYEAPKSSEKTASVSTKTTEKSKKYVPHSKRKRERMLDMNDSVLLNDNSSIFLWKKDSGRRSESLHNEHVQDLEKKGITTY